MFAIEGFGWTFGAYIFRLAVPPNVSPLLDVNLILISDDRDFSRNLAELRRRMCNVVVVIGQTPGLGLPQNANIIWKVKDFMKGEGVTPRSQKYVI